MLLALVLAEYMSFSPFVIIFRHFPVASVCFLVFFCAFQILFLIPFSGLGIV
jgi:hypothetical protein